MAKLILKKPLTGKEISFNVKGHLLLLPSPLQTNEEVCDMLLSLNQWNKAVKEFGTVRGLSIKLVF